MKKLSPLVKGLIAGAVMIGVTLAFIYSNRPPDARLQYIGYLLYAGAIAWTLIDYSHSADYNASFGSIFGQGFRCFIIITLITVIFTWVYSASHPEIAEKAAQLYREDLLKNEKNRLRPEIDKMVSEAKSQFVTGQVALAIFGSLITGAIFTAAGAGLLLMRRK